MKDKEKDLNVKGAYLHMAADTLVSVGVVISGIIIMYTGWTLVDPIIGLMIAVIIVISTPAYCTTASAFRSTESRWE